MKLLTAVMAPSQSDRVMAALDGAGFPATAVATAQASSSDGGPTLCYRGVEHRDHRRVRLEVLLSDLDLEAAVDLIRLSGGHDHGGLTVWASDVDELAIAAPTAGVPDVVSRA